MATVCLVDCNEKSLRSRVSQVSGRLAKTRELSGYLFDNGTSQIMCNKYNRSMVVLQPVNLLVSEFARLVLYTPHRKASRPSKRQAEILPCLQELL